MSTVNPALAEKIAQVRKLLELSKNNTNENEMKAAAAAADRIMQSYRIDQAMLEAADSEKCEPFVSAVVSKGGRRTAWRERVLRALVDHYGSDFFFSTGRVGGERSPGAPGSEGHTSYVVVGKKSDVEIVSYLFTWATEEIARLARWHAGGKGVKYALAWMVGCANGLADQFRDMKASARAQAEATSSMALAILDKRASETADYMAKTFKITSAKGVTGAYDRDARSAGFAVGKKMEIKQGLASGGAAPAPAMK